VPLTRFVDLAPTCPDPVFWCASVGDLRDALPFSVALSECRSRGESRVIRRQMNPREVKAFALVAARRAAFRTGLAQAAAMRLPTPRMPG
jgi:hypothetical protein